MAKFDYAKSANTANSLIEKFGTDAVLTRMIGGGGTAWEPLPATAVKWRVKVAWLPVNAKTLEQWDIKIDENMILSRVRFGYVSVQATQIEGAPMALTEILPQDTITSNGSVITCLGSSPLAPADVPVYIPFVGRI